MRSCSLFSLPWSVGSWEKLGLSTSIFPWCESRSAEEAGGDQGSSSALNLSLLCSFWVRDSSQGDKRLPGKRREVRIRCLWETGGLAEKLKAAAGGAL